MLVSEGGADTISVIDSKRLKVRGRIPTGRYPTDVQVSRKGTLVWLTAKGLGTGPNPNGPDPFHSLTLNQTGAENLQFLPHITFGDVGIGKFPSAKKLRSLTKAVGPADQAGEPAQGAAGRHRRSTRAARSSTCSSSCARTAPTTRSWATTRAATATRS